MELTDKVRDECGVIGIFDRAGGDVAKDICYGLFAIQHRGHISCGIVTNDNYKLSAHKDNGLVNDVFGGDVLAGMKGKIGIGHVRYNFGSDLRENIQPITTRYCKGTVSLAKNGTITNAAALRTALEDDGAIFQSTRDTEVIMHLLARARTHCPSAETSMLEVMGKIEGAYSMVLMSPKKLIACRDPHGFRPMCMGKLGDAIVFASETCALDAMGAEFVRDLRPGELVRVDATGVQSYDKYCGGKTSLCVYEYIFFARPDSILDGNEVYTIRERAGELLAAVAPVEADVVFGIPDGGTSFAQGYARASGLPLRAGIIKNKFSSRNLFSLDEEGRATAINLKYNVLRPIVWGKRVVLVDDSLVRGRTAAKLIRMLRDAGASQIHLRIASPRLIKSCPYGIQMPKDKNLFAAGGKTDGEMCAQLGCDSIAFLPVERLADTGLNKNFDYCNACFTGICPEK